MKKMIKIDMVNAIETEIYISTNQIVYIECPIEKYSGIDFYSIYLHNDTSFLTKLTQEELDELIKNN